jgi:hypothetical protein
MTLEERIALHRRMATSWFETYRDFPKKKVITMSSEWKWSDDAIYWSPYFSGSKEHPVGKFFKRGDLSFGSGASQETAVYADAFPDWRPVEFTCWPSENGCAWRSKQEGHNSKGVKYAAHIVNLITTNSEGLITRYESHLDSAEFGPVAMQALGTPGPFENFGAYWKILSVRIKDLAKKAA